MERGRTFSGANKVDASRLRRDMYGKKYRDLLRMSDEEALCQQVWSVWALQTGRPDLAAKFMRIPREALGAQLGEANHIPPWILESLLNARFALPPFAPQNRPGGMERTLRGDTFTAVLQAARCLRAAEDAAQGVALERLDVMKEMPRLLHRQFEWGRGWLSGPQTYRWAYLYGGDETRAYFRRTYGLSIPDFMLFGLLLYSLCKTSPAGPVKLAFEEVGLTAASCEAAMRRMVLPAGDARTALRRQRQKFIGALYQPSLLRETPVLAFGAHGERLRAPLPDLILLRVTAGLFYDLASAPPHIRNEAGDRFEAYVRDLLNTALPGFQSTTGDSYAIGKKPMNAPDVMVRDGDTVVAVVECKARKMTFAARYGDTPEAEVAVKELVKGVFQLWRHFAHDRLGLTPGPRTDANTTAMLLTLENWTQMNRPLQVHILQEAEAMCASDPRITAQDRRPVVFASIEELETTLERSDEAGFRSALREAATDRFTGWMLPNVFREVATGAIRPYPMVARMAEVLPWWSLISEDGDVQEPA